MFFRPTPTRPVSFAALIGACVALAMLPIAPAGAQNPPNSGGTVVICEATGNPNAPYVEVDVAQSDLGNFSAAEGDIIPAPASGCPAKAAGTTGPSKPKHRAKPKPKRAPTPTTTPLTTAPPATATAPATTAAPSSAPDNDAQASSVHALPVTGGHTEITVVLGLLLLYCGGVIRWAVSGPAPAATRRGPAPRL